MPWYRAIIAGREIATLTTRECLTYEQMCEQQPYRSEIEPIGFTVLSAFHHIMPDIKQELFTESKGSIGVTLSLHTPPRNIYWRNSLRCEVSDEVIRDRKYQNKDSFEADLKYINILPTTENDRLVLTLAENAYKKRFRREFDKSEDVPWTEGLFRYQWSEIDGIVVNPEDKKNCLKGCAFARIVDERKGSRSEFYKCDPETSELTALNREAIEKQLNQSDIDDLYEEYKSIRENTLSRTGVNSVSQTAVNSGPADTTNSGGPLVSKATTTKVQPQKGPQGSVPATEGLADITAVLIEKEVTEGVSQGRDNSK